MPFVFQLNSLIFRNLYEFFQFFLRFRKKIEIKKEITKRYGF